MPDSPRADSDASQGDEVYEPKEGCVEFGQEFNPSDTPPADDEPRPHEPRPAPAPGVPVSDNDYDRLKDRARRRRDQEDAPAQEDAGATPSH
jgi:hypothetical protein